LEPKGVLHVVGEAMRRGLGTDGKPWTNMGQGAPETGPLVGAPNRCTEVRFPIAEHEYAPLGGLPALREAVARLYNQRYRQGKESQYTAENVAICGGGRIGLARIVAAMGTVRLGFIPPDYTAYEGLLESVGDATPVSLEDPDFYVPEQGAEALFRVIENRLVDALLVSNPCNPTGRVRQSAELAAWVHQARESETTLLFDEFYSHFVYELDHPHSIASVLDDVNIDPVVVCDGLTKNWRYPGARVSWVVGPRSVIDVLTSTAAFLDGGCARPMQAMAVELLQPEVANQEAAAIRSCFAAKRDRIQRRLSAWGVKFPIAAEGSFYLWGDVSGLPDKWNSGFAFMEQALDHQVIVIPGCAFDLSPRNCRKEQQGKWADFVRFSFGPELGEIEAGLDRLAQALDLP